MTKEKVTVAPGQVKDAEHIEIVSATEPWAEYKLSDGSTVKVKIVMSEIWRIDGEFDGDGNPSYFFKVAPLTSVRSPDELKGKTK